MKRTAILISYLLISLTSYCQTEKQKDSLASEICKTVKEISNLSDSAILIFVYKKHVAPFLLNYPEEQRDAIATAISFRVQRNCIEIQDIANRLSPPKGDWKEETIKPVPRLNKESCRHFLDYKKYKYFEANGDTANLVIENGIWIDRFKDGTYSKLKFNWINDCEFNIEFIESNNKTRKAYSKVGDKYKYQIIEKAKSYYLMSFEIPGTNRYMTFKLYY